MNYIILITQKYFIHPDTKLNTKSTEGFEDILKS